MRKTFLLIFATLALLAGGVAPAASVAAAQKKTSRPVKKATAQPQSVYGQGYQKGYGTGFAQGKADWTRGVPQDFRRSDDVPTAGAIVRAAVCNVRRVSPGL